MAPTCHLWHQHGTYGTNMSPMTPTWHIWHQHVTYDTIKAPMTPHCSRAGKGRFCSKTMAQYGTVCNLCPRHLTWRICYVTHDTTMPLMSHMTQTLSQWHTVLELGKGDFGVKQWHNMAQYVIYPPHLTMTCMLCHPWHHDGTYVTYDTDMESMTPSWQRWHHTVLELGKGDSGVKQWQSPTP